MIAECVRREGGREGGQGEETAQQKRRRTRKASKRRRGKGWTGGDTTFITSLRETSPIKTVLWMWPSDCNRCVTITSGDRLKGIPPLPPSLPYLIDTPTPMDDVESFDRSMDR